MPHDEQSTDDRVQKIVRLRPDLVRRINRARHLRDQTFQKFVQAAVMKELAAVDAEHEARRTSERPQRREPIGLGIRERLEAEDHERQARREERAAAASSPAQAPVTVNVQAGAAAPAGADITALARMIVATPREGRKRAVMDACHALAAGRGREEALAAADLLDAEIKRLDAAPPTVLERVRARRKR